MILLVILGIILYFYHRYEPSIDITNQKDVLLYYKSGYSRKYIKLFRF